DVPQLVVQGGDGAGGGRGHLLQGEQVPEVGRFHAETGGEFGLRLAANDERLHPSSGSSSVDQGVSSGYRADSEDRLGGVGVQTLGGWPVATPVEEGAEGVAGYPGGLGDRPGPHARGGQRLHVFADRGGVDQVGGGAAVGGHA